MRQTTTTASGVAVPASITNSATVTQATWRFYGNKRVTPIALVKPLHDFAKQQINNDQYVLAAVDWSKLDYKKHTSKTDIVQLTHAHDVGYELTTQLLISAVHGGPIAPIQMHLKTANGYLSTAETAPPAEEHRLEQVTPLMRDAAKMGFSPKIVHLIDREGDSVFLYRQWDEEDFLFLVRCDDRLVRYQNRLLKCSDVAALLDKAGEFVQSRSVLIKGMPAIQYVAEAKIVLDRPTRRKVSGRVVTIHGKALTLRLVITRVVDPVSGEVLSTWYMLTNVPSDVSAEQIALWYYWRWEIESYFKLMKSGGQQLEHWQQESGLAVLKRMLVASMACAVVWSLQANGDAESEAFKLVLVRLSGKRLKRGSPPTAGVLLSGLFVWLQMIDFIAHIDADLTKIEQLKTKFNKLLPRMEKNV